MFGTFSFKNTNFVLKHPQTNTIVHLLVFLLLSRVECNRIEE